MNPGKYKSHCAPVRASRSPLALLQLYVTNRRMGPAVGAAVMVGGTVAMAMLPLLTLLLLVENQVR